MNRLAQWRLEQEGDVHAVKAGWRGPPITAGVWHQRGPAYGAKQIAKLAAAYAAVGEE